MFTGRAKKNRRVRQDWMNPARIGRTEEHMNRYPLAEPPPVPPDPAPDENGNPYLPNGR